MWYSFDRGEVEVIPGSQVANVPPEVKMLTAAEHGVDFEHEIYRWVGRGKVRLEGGGGVVG